MVLVQRDNLLARFLIIGSMSLCVAAATPYKKGARTSDMRSLLHIFPPRGDRPDAEFFAPTCTPSPPLTHTPPRDELDDEPKDRHVRAPGEKGSNKPIIGIRTKVKVTKCREGSAAGVKKSNHKLNDSAKDNAGEVSGALDLTINGINVVEEGVAILPSGEETPPPSKNKEKAIDSPIASANGVMFEYGQEDGSVDHIGGNANEVENASSANPEGPVTLYYDDIGNFYTANEIPRGVTKPSDTGFTQIVNGATAGMESFEIGTVEHDDMLEMNGDASDGLDHRDKSGGSSRSYAALCVSFLVVLL